MKKILLLVLSQVIFFTSCTTEKVGTIHPEYFIPIVQELEALWDSEEDVRNYAADKWREEEVTSGGSYENKTFTCLIEGEVFSFDLEEKLSNEKVWHWELAGTFRYAEKTYVCLYDMNFLYEENHTQSPQLLLIEFLNDAPESYEITSYSVEPSYIVSWLNSCYRIGDTIYIAGEKELVAINLNTKELRYCRDEYLFAEKCSKEICEIKECNIFHFRAILEQDGVTIYSAEVSRASDELPVGRIFVAYEANTAVSYMYVDFTKLTIDEAIIIG